MGLPTLCHDNRQVLTAAFDALAFEWECQPIEAEWRIRRMIALRLAGRSDQEIPHILQAESVGEPWASWPADAPRF